MHGVWGWDQKKNAGIVLRESYFKRDPDTGKEVSGVPVNTEQARSVWVSH